MSVWGVAGYGRGRLSLTPQYGEKARADFTRWLAAAGGRRVILTPEEAGGFEVALTADGRHASAAFVGKAYELDAGNGHTLLLRLGTEASRRYAFDCGAAATPRLELGVCQDGSNAETGFEVVVADGLVYAWPAGGGPAELDGRALVAQTANAMRDWDVADRVAWDARPDSPLGLSMSLAPHYGGAAQGGHDALFGQESFENLNGSGATQGYMVQGVGLSNDLRRYRSVKCRYGNRVQDSIGSLRLSKLFSDVRI